MDERLAEAEAARSVLGALRVNCAGRSRDWRSRAGSSGGALIVRRGHERLPCRTGPTGIPITSRRAAC